MKNLAVRVLARLFAPILMPFAIARGLMSLFAFDVTYPPRPGSIDGGGVLTISSFLKEPTFIARRMREISDKTFVGDKILGGRATSESGMVAYGQTEGIYADGSPETIEPGGEFPMTTIPLVANILEAIKKVGLATEITLESVQRLRWDPVDRALRKLRNRQIQAFDLVVMAKIAATFGSIPTVTGSDWGTATDATPVRHVLQAIAEIRDKQEGYEPNTLLLNHDKFVEWVGNEAILRMLARFAGGDGSFTVEENRIILPGANLQILSQPTGTAVTDPLVFDSMAFGSIVRGADDDPADDGVRVETRYYTSAEVSPASQSEVWRLSTKRERLPIIQEPEAAIRITGT
jgi:hypothetical protein